MRLALLFVLCCACVLRTPTLTARTPSLSAGVSGAAAPASAPSDDEPADDQLIEAGCTFNGSQIKGEPGTVRRVACPGDCNKEAVVFGTDVYTSDSPLCPAAMHAGAISARGGEVTVVVEGPRPAYRGSKRNGITTRDWGAYRGSYRFTGLPAAPPPAPVAARPVVIEAGCSFRSNEIRAEPGTAHRVSCPAGCNVDPRPIWGSDPYTGDSPICVAAIHAGLVGERGGEVTVIVDEGRPAYRGSKRNGLASGDYGAYRASFRFQR